jgi:hypothetical protein
MFLVAGFTPRLKMVAAPECTRNYAAVVSNKCYSFSCSLLNNVIGNPDCTSQNECWVVDYFMPFSSY